MFIVIHRGKVKATVLIKTLAVMLVAGLALPWLYGIISASVPAMSKEVNFQTGKSPMRMERSKETRFDKAMDQFVIQLQDFYYEERE
ncbi:MAG: hypothetical protein ACM3MK_05035 [Chitinophagales bacterium]